MKRRRSADQNRRQPTPRGNAERRAAALRSYVAPAVVAHIMSDGRTPLLSGVRIPVTVLFADIRSFTKLADRLRPETVVRMLDEYFEAMCAAGVAHGAMIDKLIGDAVMLLYGVPVARGDEAVRAARTADEMHQRFAALATQWRRIPRVPRLGLGIGAASGEAVLGNIGSAARTDYTVVGATVNLAARLAAAAASGRTLVNTALRDDLVRTSPRLFGFGAPRKMGLKGFRGGVVAHTCRGRKHRPIAAAAISAHDPVCGMKLDPRTAITSEHRGQSYFFCSRSCAAAFSADPSRYAVG